MPSEILYSDCKKYAWHPSVFHGGSIPSANRYEHFSQRNSAEEFRVLIRARNRVTHSIDTEEIGNQFDPWFSYFKSSLYQYTVVQSNQLHFSRLVEKWHEEKGVTSSVTEIISCPAHLAIIGMGEKALPLIFSQIEREGDDPDYWFAALEAITGDDPVLEEDYGDTVRMGQAWLSWAEENYVR